jgi:hypothetical protein
MKLYSLHVLKFPAYFYLFEYLQSITEPIGIRILNVSLLINYQNFYTEHRSCSNCIHNFSKLTLLISTQDLLL